MSIILATDRYETIRPVVHHLRRQSVRGQLEIVMVTPDQQSLGLEPSELEGFAGIRVVEVESLHPLGVARAAGVRAARAPLVFIGETHTYGHPTWAETLIDAHARPWAAVVPGFGNANPRSALSWAIFLLDYGYWLYALPSHEASMSPTHNVAYKRQVLLELGHGLEPALSQGDRLPIELRKSGHQSYFESAARLDHLNVAQPAPWIRERFLAGLLLAGRRAQRWSALRRVVYFCGSPLIPAVILFRLRKPIGLAFRNLRLPAGTLPALVMGTLISTMGEMVGYMRGADRSADLAMMELEVHKLRYASSRTRVSR
ncbi:MAG: hypothetical protein ACJ8DC_12620 [Gemmatimonadales bacterium]